MTKLTNTQIENLIIKYPEIAYKVISDYETSKLINKKFNVHDLKKILELQKAGIVPATNPFRKEL